MKLEGLHHVTMITGHAQRTVDFYADVLGLRLVKTTVNFDQPDAYHLYFGDEAGSPGSILTWFEFRGASPGRPGAGMVHRLVLAVPSAAALDFWAGRLEARGVATTREGDGLRFADPDGLALELVPHDIGAVLAAEHPEVPAEHAISGVQGARAYSANPDVSAAVVTQLLGFDARDDGASSPAARSGTCTGRSTRRRASAGSRAPAPSTTSPGPRATRTTRRGGSAWPRRGRR